MAAAGFACAFTFTNCEPSTAIVRATRTIVAHSKLFLPEADAVAKGTPKIRPVIKPPRWHMLSMPTPTLTRPNPIAKLNTMKKVRLLKIARRCKGETATLPNLMPARIAPAMPKIAPDAPTSNCRGFQARVNRLPPTPVRMYTANVTQLPNSLSESRPRLQSAHILNAMWYTPPWTKPAVTRRQYSPSRVRGPMFAPQRTTFSGPKVATPPVINMPTSTAMLMATSAVVAGKSLKVPVLSPRRARLVARPAQRSHRTGAIPSSLTASSAPHFRQLGIAVSG